MYKRVKIEYAAGETLAHDVTEVDISKGFKGVRFKKGHIIKEEEIEIFKQLGKESVFVLEGENAADIVHEDDASMELAPLIAGSNIYYDRQPSEGKINFYAEIDGLLKIDKERVIEVNKLKIPSLPTKHGNVPVKKGDVVAAFRIIPLYCKKEVIENCKKILKSPAISVKPYLYKKAGIIVTGNEFFTGRKKDSFTEKMRDKLSNFGVDVIKHTILPDDVEIIANKISSYLNDVDILLITGGTSVDPDDCTKKAIAYVGASIVQEGNPIQPGNNFTLGYIQEKIVCGVPAASLFYKATALDIFLPRLLAGEKISADEVAAYSIGGLCYFCKVCLYPVCPFGKSVC
jgi:molybdenum cofactor synthesis domain-containing protein